MAPRLAHFDLNGVVVAADRHYLWLLAAMSVTVLFLMGVGLPLTIPIPGPPELSKTAESASPPPLPTRPFVMDGRSG